MSSFAERLSKMRTEICPTDLARWRLLRNIIRLVAEECFVNAC